MKLTTFKLPNGQKCLELKNEDIPYVFDKWVPVNGHFEFKVNFQFRKLVDEVDFLFYDDTVLSHKVLYNDNSGYALKEWMYDEDEYVLCKLERVVVEYPPVQKVETRLYTVSSVLTAITDCLPKHSPIEEISFSDFSVGEDEMIFIKWMSSDFKIKIYKRSDGFTISEYRNGFTQDPDKSVLLMELLTRVILQRRREF